MCAFFIPERVSERARLTPFSLSLCVCVCVFVNFTGRVREILRPVVRGMRSLSLFVFGWRFEILLFLFFCARAGGTFSFCEQQKVTSRRADVVLLLLRERRTRRCDGLFRSMVALAIFADACYLYRSFLEYT